MRYAVGAVKPWVQAAADEVGTRFGIATIGGYGTRPNETDHDDGLALDFMTSGSKGDQLAAYVQANAARLGVTYIIWKQRIWSVSRAAEGWRPMEDRGGVTANHFDHVHVSFKPSAPAAGGGVVQPTTSVSSNLVDAAAVHALLDPLPWFGDKLSDRLDEATAGIVKAATGLAVAAVLVAGGVALVVAGIAKSTTKS